MVMRAMQIQVNPDLLEKVGAIQLIPVSPHVVPFYQELLDYLGLTASVVSTVGDIINEGEKFTLRFTATNLFQYGYPAFYLYGSGRPTINFLKPYLYVKATTYAKPVPAVGWLPFPDTRLRSGEATHLDVEFEALQALEGDAIEHVATAKIWALFDHERYFTMEKYLQVTADIVQG